jgi:hypothetical protein
MAVAMKTRKVIGLWLDSDSGEEPAWIVSRDLMNERGEAETTHTVSVFPRDRYNDAYDEAMRIGERDGLTVIETHEHGTQTIHYETSLEVYADGRHKLV